MSQRKHSDYYGPTSSIVVNGVVGGEIDLDTNKATLDFPMRELSQTESEVLQKLFPNTGEQLQRLLNIELILEAVQ